MGGRGSNSATAAIAEEAVDLSYMQSHRPSEVGGLLSDISAVNDPDEWGAGGPGSFMPTDVYEHPEWYFIMNLEGARESFNIVKRLRGADPDTEITIYRGSPRAELNTGDWVAISREYADIYAGDGAYSDNPDSRVHEYRVRIGDLVWAGDDIREFGYFGKRMKAK